MDYLDLAPRNEEGKKQSTDNRTKIIIAVSVVSFALLIGLAALVRVYLLRKETTDDNSARVAAMKEKRIKRLPKLPRRDRDRDAETADLEKGATPRTAAFPPRTPLRFGRNRKTSIIGEKVISIPNKYELKAVPAPFPTAMLATNEGPRQISTARLDGSFPRSPAYPHRVHNPRSAGIPGYNSDGFGGAPRASQDTRRDESKNGSVETLVQGRTSPSWM